MEYHIRELTSEEYPLLNEFLYQAIYLPEGTEPPGREIILEPDLQVYIQNFGRNEWDLALGAEIEDKIIGAVWVRIMHDYGHIDDNTPSLAISLLPAFRGRGIGSALLKKMLDFLRERGCQAVSLSVQSDNYAKRFYERAGFRTICIHGSETIMRCEL